MGRATRERTRGRRLRRTAFVGTSLIAGVGLIAGAAAVVHTSRAEGALTSEASSSSSTSTSTTTIPPTTTTVAPTTTTMPPPPGADGTLELGEHGDEILLLQTRLRDLGFWLGTPDGTYGQLTRQAVLAFQKAQGLGRDGVAGPGTMGALASAARPSPREPSGSHLEIDLDRQLLLIVQDGHTLWAINTSTGSGDAYAAPGGGTAVATTPSGSFTIDREVDGYRKAALGTLYRPKYFHGGIAIHGAGQIPAHPASHGCARVTNSAMDMLWASGVASIGTLVLVH